MADVSTAVAPVAKKRSPTTFTDQLVEPLSRLRSEVDRLFEDFPRRWPRIDVGSFFPPTAGMPIPAVEMTETDEAYKLAVEVPGVDVKDIEITVDDDMLVISGEKKSEREEKEKDVYVSERSYGAFERRIALPPAADRDKISANAKNGLLQITLPKSPKAQESKRKIAIEGA